MNELRSALQDYLRVRRALGYKLTETGRLLGQFVAYCEQSGTTTVTTDVAVAWATLPATAHASWWGQRLSKVRCFATWLQTLDPATEVPPPDILPGRPRRAVPYLYTDAEVCAIMEAARSLRSPLQQHTYHALVGLLAVTGCRVGEVIRLDRDDVRLGTGLVRVTKSKFNKSREIPLHPSTVEALQRYVQVRDRLCPKPRSGSFFLSTAGSALTYSRVRSTFQRLAQQAGLRPRTGRCRPPSNREANMSNRTAPTPLFDSSTLTLFDMDPTSVVVFTPDRVQVILDAATSPIEHGGYSSGGLLHLAISGDLNALQVFTVAAAQVMPPEVALRILSDAVAIPGEPGQQGWAFPHTSLA